MGDLDDEHLDDYEWCFVGVRDDDDDDDVSIDESNDWIEGMEENDDENIGNRNQNTKIGQEYNQLWTKIIDLCSNDH